MHKFHIMICYFPNLEALNCSPLFQLYRVTEFLTRTIMKISSLHVLVTRDWKSDTLALQQNLSQHGKTLDAQENNLE